LDGFKQIRCSCQFRHCLLLSNSSIPSALLLEGMHFGEEHYYGTGQNAGQAEHAYGVNAASDGLLSSAEEEPSAFVTTHQCRRQ
jgi:hypothetical protein